MNRRGFLGLGTALAAIPVLGSISPDLPEPVKEIEPKPIEPVKEIEPKPIEPVKEIEPKFEKAKALNSNKYGSTIVISGSVLIEKCKKTTVISGKGHITDLSEQTLNKLNVVNQELLLYCLKNYKEVWWEIDTKNHVLKIEGVVEISSFYIDYEQDHTRIIDIYEENFYFMPARQRVKINF